ncbi:thioredoxin-like protein [Multifurca ochricompacta]|uniref:Thioredoxin-like protein n=1 Tax=Multifurca ochricompacta TaxID=376703 RepID=A0AAD4LUZ1_9AGAM|nr:thioredoxin-like protein [Multifurca ochricompacta]
MLSALFTPRTLRTFRSSFFHPRPFSTSRCRLEQFHGADEATFNRLTSATRTNGRVVLVDFYADWCPPCKALSPILEKLAEDAGVKTGSGRPIDLVTVNTDEQSSLAQQYAIRALPTVAAFRDGKMVNQFVGALPESGVRKFLEDV